MTRRRILKFPDPRLRRKAEQIEEVTEGIHRLVEDMLETMYDAPGVGLAGPQVGVMKRVFVMDCSSKDDEPSPRALINPVVTWQSESLLKREEGCLSLPDQFADVVRPETVRARFLDLNGKESEEEFSGLPARCVQHEIDHLDGILFIDRLSLVKRQMIKRRMAKESRERNG